MDDALKNASVVTPHADNQNGVWEVAYRTYQDYETVDEAMAVARELGDWTASVQKEVDQRNETGETTRMKKEEYLGRFVRFGERLCEMDDDQAIQMHLMIDIAKSLSDIRDYLERRVE